MYNALIIGAGQIAGGYDVSGSEAILTHAHAYKNNNKINLLGFYDINFNQAQKMSNKWNTKAFNSLDEVSNVDIVSICTPDFCHLETVKNALYLNPKLIFLEKPLSNNQKDTKEICEISKKTPILVNFSRRFVKEFQELSIRIKNNEFGEYQTGNGYYGKGYTHNGSHMRNLLELLISDITNSTIIEEIHDFFDKDFTKTAILEFKNNKKFFMHGTNCNYFSIFELDLIFEKARIQILNLGYEIKIFKIENSEKYSGYKILKLSEQIHTELDYAMKNAIINICEYLENKIELISTPKEVL